MLTASDTLVFGHFELQPAQRLLLDDGSAVKLGSRAFDLLVVLTEHARLVTKDELMKRVWQGVVVEENNLTVQVSALRKVLGDEAIATVQGHGYRFTLPVSSIPDRAPGTRKPPSAEALALPGKPSVVVLPLTHREADPAKADVIDGITDGLITGLGRFRSLFVVSRGSAFSYQGQDVDARAVGRELGVRYVVEGSVRRAGRRMRVAVNLVDALDGRQIWSERYDRELRDAFALQDELASAILAAIAPWIEKSELAHVRRARPDAPTADDLTAGELALSAWARAREGLSQSSQEQRDEAIALARRALAIDPLSTIALNAIGEAEFWHLYFGTTSERERALENGLWAARQALAIDSADHLAYRGRGWIRFSSGDLAGAISDFRRSLELNPNDCFTLARLGICEALSGNLDGGTRHCLDALRLSPRDPSRFHLLDCLVWTHFASLSYDEGIDVARRSLAEADFAGTRLCLVLCLVGSGDRVAAAAELQTLHRRAPVLVATRLGGTWLATDPEVRRREVEFLDVAEGVRRSMSIDIDRSAGTTAEGRSGKAETIVPQGPRPTGRLLNVL